MKPLPKNLSYIFTYLLLVSFFLACTVMNNAQEFEDEEFVQDEKPAQNISQNDAIKLFNQGQDAHARGDLNTALDFYNKALKVKPNFVEAEYQRATILKIFGKLDQAEKSFRKTLELRPKWNLALVSLGSLLTQKGHYSEAEAILLRAISTDPSNYLAYNSLTESLIRSEAPKEKLETTLAALTELTNATAAPTSIWVSKGMIERSLGNLNAAKASINYALLLNSKDILALSEMIEIALAKNDSKLALDKAKVLAAAHPDSTTAKILLARSYDSNEKPEEALKILGSIKNPGASVIAMKNAIKFRGNENTADLEKLLISDQNNVSVLGKLCSLMRTTDPQKALDYCRKALELDKSNINYAVGYGAALVQLKQYPTAVAVFKNLLKYDADNYTVRANLATAHFQMQQFEQAKTEYKWIVSQKPDLAVGFYFLAICYDKLEEYEDALENYERFLKLAKAKNNLLEIEKVELRLPGLESQIKNGKGRKRKGEK